MAACALTRLLIGVVALGFVPACGHTPPRSEFMELAVREAKGDQQPSVGDSHQVAQSQESRTGLGVAVALAESNGRMELLLGAGLLALFFGCVFLVQESEEPKPKGPPPSIKKMPKSSSATRLTPSGSADRLNPYGSFDHQVQPPQQQVIHFEQQDEATLLLNSMDRQEEALRFKEDAIRREEDFAWRRQEEAIQREKEALMQREEELRARYERMEALHPRPPLFTPGPYAVPATAPSLSASAWSSPPPRSAPLYESALSSPPQTTKSPSLFEQAALHSPPPKQLGSQLGSPQGEAREMLAFQAQTTTYEQMRRDTDNMASSFAGQAQPLKLSPRPPATSPILASSFNPVAFSSSSPVVPATAPSAGEEELSPEQLVTLQNIMEQTGASREATLRAMKKARAEEEAILKNLEARNRQKRATPHGGGFI